MVFYNVAEIILYIHYFANISIFVESTLLRTAELIKGYFYSFSIFVSPCTKYQKFQLLNIIVNKLTLTKIACVTLTPGHYLLVNIGCPIPLLTSPAIPVPLATCYTPFYSSFQQLEQWRVGARESGINVSTAKVASSLPGMFVTHSPNGSSYLTPAFAFGEISPKREYT